MIKHIICVAWALTIIAAQNTPAAEWIIYKHEPSRSDCVDLRIANYTKHTIAIEYDYKTKKQFLKAKYLRFGEIDQYAGIIIDQDFYNRFDGKITIKEKDEQGVPSTKTLSYITIRHKSADHGR